MLDQLAHLRNAQTGRASSWEETGRNSDAWWIEPGESAVLADIKGPGRITHLWLTQSNHYRECLLKITWDDADHSQRGVPFGRFLRPRPRHCQLLPIPALFGLDAQQQCF